LVESATNLIIFFQEAFDAKELSRLIRPDGSLMNAQMKIGDSIIMIGERGSAFPAVICSTHLYVRNVDDIYARCLKLGAISVSEPKSFSYGDRTAGIKDVAGNIWWIGTHEFEIS
jgi:PhnB protein